MATFTNRIERHPVAVTATASFSLYVVAAIDYLTGSDLSFSVFYLLPVMVCTFVAGRRTGYGISALAVILWVLADALLGLWVQWHLLWNAAIRLSFLALVVELVSALRTALNRESRLARQDQLTGISNGRAFLEQANIVIDRCRKAATSLSMAYLDCDNFKAINDEHGHDTGDEVIRSIGQALKRTCRDGDVVARLGGDEFAMLCPATTSEEAADLLDRVKACVLEDLDSRGWPVTLSIGIVTYAIPPDPARELLKQADGLMYEAKAAGRNCTIARSFHR